jgi:hypothetical protein
VNFEKINVNINKDDDAINDYLFCISLFGEIPNRISIFSSYNTKEFSKFIDKHSKDKKISKEIIPGGQDTIVNQKSFVKITDEIYLSYVEYDRESDLSFISDLVFYFKNGCDDEVNNFISSLNSFVMDFGHHSSQQRFNTLMLTDEGLQLEPIDVLDSDYENMNLYYNQSVIKDSKKLLKSIKTKKKGLSVIHGERGTGKTTLIIDILSKIDKICMFIPASMIDIVVNSNEFRAFIKRYKNSVIVIDDCEIFFSHTYTKSNIFTNNLIQMIDGVCSDMNSLHIITIFNTENINHIDPILFESNNYLSTLEVDRLNKNQVDTLCQHFNIKNKFDTPKVIDVIRNNHAILATQEMGF